MIVLGLTTGSVLFSFIAFSNFLATVIGIEAPMAVSAPNCVVSKGRPKENESK
jgi:hypothetical protein